MFLRWIQNTRWIGKCLILLVWLCILLAYCITKKFFFDDCVFKKKIQLRESLVFLKIIDFIYSCCAYIVTLFIYLDTLISLLLPYTRFGQALFIVYGLFIFLVIMVHIKVIYQDPGYTYNLIPKEPPHSHDVTSISSFCQHCFNWWKPPRAHHCKTCNKCVFRMDHHCIWIDNCVGILNQKFYILFLFYSTTFCGYQLILILINCVLWILQTSYYQVLVLNGIAATIISIFFYITMNFLKEQLDHITKNCTLVESFQHLHGIQKKNHWDNFVDIFGTGSKFLWFVPISPQLDIHFSEPVVFNKSIQAELKRIEKQRKHIIDTAKGWHYQNKTKLIQRNSQIHHHNVVMPENPLEPPCQELIHLWPTLNRNGSLMGCHMYIPFFFIRRR